MKTPMRSYFLGILITFSFLSCDSNDKSAPGHRATVHRDTAITPQNSYNNLFLDSLQVVRFFDHTDDTLYAQVRNFYNARNYEFAWFSDEGLTLSAEGFWNSHEDYLKQAKDSSIYDQTLHKIMDTLLYADSVSPLPRDMLVETELRLTKHFFLFAQTAFGAKADPGELQWYIPKRRLNIQDLLDSLLLSQKKTWQPLNPRYHLLGKAIGFYRSIYQQGGWPVLDITNRKWRVGDKSSEVKKLKQRLVAERHWPAADSSLLYTDSLANVVAKIQGLYGQEQNGIADGAFMKALNVPVSDRIAQMLVNLERIKWMPQQPASFIFINIPEYRFRLIEENKTMLSMDIIVGKAANRTVIFSDELQYIVFSPYWNIPRSIVRNEIVPAMNKSNSYIRRNNMEITGYSAGLPIVRQKPGNNNALGRVKFLFPNQYNIYFHDTPAKGLFSRQKRAFSHGCIRLQEPVKLAKYLLQNDSTWTDAAIEKAMSLSTEKWVNLDRKWPVFITYFTSWADNNGNVHFLEDIYGHDQKLKDRLLNY